MSENALERRTLDSGELREAFYEELETKGMRALWNVMGGFVLPEPRSPAVPALWSFAQVRPLLIRAGELITAEEAERRVLILENPGLPGSSLITRTLYCGLQLIKPGEVAACHRHTQNALRFVLEGSGAYTVVDGEKVVMERFDLVLTPNMTGHDHANPTDHQMIWLDGLDLGLVQSFDGAFSDRLTDEGTHAEPPLASTARRRYERNMRPIGRNPDWARPCRSRVWPAPIAPEHGRRSPVHYPYAKWRQALETMRQAGDPDRHYGFKFELIDPLEGGAVMQTISAFAQLVPEGLKTQESRVTDGTIYTVVEGGGIARIGGTRFDLAPLSTFVVPAWSAFSLEARGDLVLFSYSDRVAQKALGLWREQLHAA